ncbi:efflux RND transporter periplasmic adaptor subunit [Halopseudomonas maritima]|uniref:efflux RND transporter periplasmic adaptor subunit n=1 Tax=Halopseudomonas maritima TaxID=2918528 RepID=UPI001EEA2B40|nr:HlyD family efflux transporter periplasmic adaptor subunit [Halopseudomonas maritima]UJJ30181.1 HlyD family efflux transporter periplasmic adaptor subunit [Halopseudomonas maritima]
MRKRLTPAVIVLVGIVIFIILRVTRDQPEPVGSQERAWRVATETISPDAFQPRLTLYGQLESPRRFTVVAPLAGRIAALPANDGASVKQGELLIALDDADIQPRIAQARAELADAKAQLESEKLANDADQQALRMEQRLEENARKALERMQQLVERQMVPAVELDNAQDVLDRAALTVANRKRSLTVHPSRLAAQQARVERAEAALDSTLRDAERSRFVAPFDGVVGSVQVAVGDQVGANASLLDFYPLDGMELRALVPQIHSQDFINALNEGQQLEARSLDVQPPLELTLTRIAGQADASGIEALFRVENPRVDLRLGNLMAISVARPSRDDSVALPYSALYGNNTVYTLNDGRLQAIAVEQVGETRDASGQRRVLVRSSQLQSGMPIVITHLPNAISGLKVDSTEPEPAQ